VQEAGTAGRGPRASAAAGRPRLGAVRAPDRHHRPEVAPSLYVAIGIFGRQPAPGRRPQRRHGGPINTDPACPMMARPPRRGRRRGECRGPAREAPERLAGRVSRPPTTSRGGRRPAAARRAGAARAGRGSLLLERADQPGGQETCPRRLLRAAVLEASAPDFWRGAVERHRTPRSSDELPSPPGVDFRTATWGTSRSTGSPCCAPLHRWLAEQAVRAGATC